MVYKNYHPYKPEERERLTVEINGIVANKQIEERQAVQEAPTPPPQVAEKEPEKEEPKKPKTPPIEKKKVLAKREEATHKIEPELQKEITKPMAPQNMDAQKQQTTANPQEEAAVMQRYARAFKKKLHEHVVFPSEAKGKGYMGVPKVGFMISEDGSVPKESIKIIKSSGYDILDQKAILAVLESSPFERPPKAFNAEVDLDFSTHQ